MSDMKLKSLIEGFIGNRKNQWSATEKKAALEMIGKYNEYGRALRREHNLMEIAQTLAEIADNAERFAMNETEDGFDKHTVARNMKELKNYSGQFQKLARESYVVEQRMEALYEDMGATLGRYFSIKDDIAESKINSTDAALDSIASAGR